MFVLLATFFIIAISMFVALRCKRDEPKEAKPVTPPPEKKQQSLPKSKTHPLSFAVLKGHDGPIICCKASLNGWAIASASERHVRLWIANDVEQGAKDKRYVRLPVPLDTCTCFAFANNLLLCGTSSSKVIGFALSQASASTMPTASQSFDFATHHEYDELIAVGVTPDGTVGVSSSASTDIRVWSLPSGKCLQKLLTNQIKNTSLSLSSQGMMCVGAFLPGAKIWSIKNIHLGKKAVHCMTLTGQRVGSHSVGFSEDGKMAFSATKDDVILWNVDVRWSLQEDPKQLVHIHEPSHHASLSPDGRVLCLAHGPTIRFLSAADGHELDVIVVAHNEGYGGVAASVTSMEWSPNSEFLLSSGDGSKHIKVWRVPKSI